MSSRVRFTFHGDEFARMKSPAGEIGRSVFNAAEETKRRAQAIIAAEGRVDTGEMMRDIEVSTSQTQFGMVSCTVTATSPHAIYQHEGVDHVEAAPGRVLRFRPKGSAVFIFRPRTSGFAGIKFLTRAVKSIGVRDFHP